MNGHDDKPNSRLISLVIALTLMVSCAEIALPPGGPEDKQSPFLLGSIPENGAVNVDSGNSVTLFFSEAVVKPKSGKGFFISPRPDQEPDVSWKSDRVIIELAEVFEPDVTYVISAASAIADLRGNKIDSGLTVAFTRSDTIDLGRLSGKVVNTKGRPATGLTVALFDPEEVAQSGYDSLYADYVTETNGEGQFSMKFLAPGEYSLIVFDDVDRDEYFSSSSEPVALPDRPIIVSDEHALEDLIMTLVSKDTTVPEILNVTVNPDGLLRTRLSRSIGLEFLKAQPDLAVMVDEADSLMRFPALTFQEYQDDSATMLSFWFGSLPAATYELRLDGDETMRFDGVEVSATEDNTEPTILALTPEDDSPIMMVDLDLGINFSEPIDKTGLTPQTFVLTNLATEEVLLVQLAWRTLMAISLEPEGLESGQSYRLDITEFELADLAGNRLGDSLRSQTITLVNEEDLGAISGLLKVLVAGRENDPIELTIENVDNRASYRQMVLTGEFVVAVPAGKYLLKGFVDSDRNGTAGYGSLDPFAYAETQAVHADTIAVRARFETAGIEFIIE